MFHRVTSIDGTSWGVRVMTLGPGVDCGGAPSSLVNDATTSLFWLRSKTSTVTNPASSIDHLPPASAVTSQLPLSRPYYRFRIIPSILSWNSTGGPGRFELESACSSPFIGCAEHTFHLGSEK